MHDCQSDREATTSDRPRERLDALGSSALSDAELVALLLRTGNRGSNALTVATDLLGRHGGLQGLSRVSGRELGQSQGIGPAKSATLRAALEIGRVVRETCGDKSAALLEGSKQRQRLTPEAPGTDDEHRHRGGHLAHRSARDRMIEATLSTSALVISWYIGRIME